MKKIYFLFFILSLVFVSCSNPESDAKKIAEQYASQIKNYSSCNAISEFKDLQENSLASIKEGYDKAEAEYKSDGEKWNLFVDTYQKEIEGANSEFMTAFTDFVKSTLTTNELYERADVKNGYYLFSFDNDTMKIGNCKTGISYNLMGDTIIFDDENKTELIISTDDSALVLTDPETNKQCKFNTTEEKSKFYGSWSASYSGVSVTVTFNPNGNAYSSMKYGYQKVNRNDSWTIKDSKIKYLTPNSWDPYKFVSDDHFSLVDYEGTNWNFYRIKKSTPKNVSEILFE